MTESREVATPQIFSGDATEAGEIMKNFLKLYLAAKSLVDRQNGQGLTEYAMAFSLIALGTVAGQTAVAQQVNHTFISIATTITTSIMQ